MLLMKLPVFSLPLLGLLALAACHRQESAAPAGAPEPEPAPIAVTTRVAEEKPMPRYLRVTGELKGSQDAMVAADATGKVKEVKVERGSVVQAGDPLIILDERTAALSLKEAEASVASAQLKLTWVSDELKRNAPLAAERAISDSDFQRLKNDKASAETSVTAAIARRDSAKKALDDSVIRAPFAGTVAERLVEQGEYVRTDSQVVHLVAIDTLHLLLNVPETAVGALQEGQAVGFSVPAYPEQDFTGTVKFIGAAVRGSARDLVIEAEVKNTDGRLKPGMFAEGRLSLGSEPSVVIPAKALRTEGSTKKVLVVNQEQRVEERLVEVGETQGDQVAIRRGVEKGERVIVSPPAETADGMKVTFVSNP